MNTTCINLTPYEKNALFNMTHDRYYSIKAQCVSDDVREEFLKEWEEVLWGIMQKMKSAKWDDAGEVYGN